MITLNKLYKINSPKVIIHNARQFFGDDVTLENEKLNRRWVDKPFPELLRDISMKLPSSRNKQDVALNTLRDIFVTKRTSDDT